MHKSDTNPNLFIIGDGTFSVNSTHLVFEHRMGDFAGSGMHIRVQVEISNVSDFEVFNYDISEQLFVENPALDVHVFGSAASNGAEGNRIRKAVEKPLVNSILAMGKNEKACRIICYDGSVSFFYFKNTRRKAAAIDKIKVRVLDKNYIPEPQESRPRGKFFGRGKPVNLPVMVGETMHTVSVLRKRNNMYELSVDGVWHQTYTTGKQSRFSPNEDFPLVINGADFIVAVRGKKIRLVYNNMYLGSNEEFVPAKPFPKWFWIFLVLNGIMLFLGGAIPAVIAVISVAACANAVHFIKGTVAKIGICIAITMASWLALMVVSIIFAILVP